MNYQIISLLKDKVTPKSKSKLYNCNKLLKCTNIKLQINILSLLLYYLFLNTTTICVTIYSCMMKETRIPIHKQMVQLNIYQTHMAV